jgi:hypothetical protein
MTIAYYCTLNLWVGIFCFGQILVGFRQECVGNQCSASCFTGRNTRTCDGFENRICRLVAILFTFATNCCFPHYLPISVTAGDCDRTAVSISQMSLAIHWNMTCFSTKHSAAVMRSVNLMHLYVSVTGAHLLSIGNDTQIRKPFEENVWTWEGGLNRRLEKIA